MINNPEVTVGILAGGRGERMDDLTAQQQKCLLPIDNKPILLHTLESLHQAFGSVKLVMALSYRSDDVIEFVNNNLPSNMIVDYCFDHNKGTSFAYHDILESVSSEYILFSSGDAVVKPFVYEKLLNKSITKSETIIGISTNIDEADTHPLVKINGDRVSSYRWPSKNIIPENGEFRDMTVVASKRIDLLDLVNGYNSQPSIVGAFKDAINDQKKVLVDIFNNDWLHVAYPDDLKKHWMI